MLTVRHCTTLLATVAVTAALISVACNDDVQGPGLVDRDSSLELSRNMGSIVFRSTQGPDTEIVIMNGDGSNQTQLTFNAGAGDTRPALSPNGRKIAWVSSLDGDFEIFTMNVDGSDQTQLTFNTDQDWNPDWSPDGRSLVFYRTGGGIWVIDTQCGTPGQANPECETQLASGPDYQPRWSPDGKQIVFTSNRDGNGEIYVMNADGSDPVNLTNHPNEDQWPSWSRAQGGRIAFTRFTDGSDGEIYVMRTDGSDLVRLTDNTGIEDWYPSWSPNGRSIAFWRLDGINDEIYVVDADGGNLTQLTDNPGTDGFPNWGRGVVR